MSGQTSVFLGKWIVQGFFGPWDGPMFGGFAASTTFDGSKKHVAALDADCLCIWMPPDVKNFDLENLPSAALIALVTRVSDGAMCFQVNTGKYVGLNSGYLALVDNLSAAQGFVMDPAPDLGWRVHWDLIFSISAGTSYIANSEQDQEVLIMSAEGPPFQISPRIPSTDVILSNKNGDGLDLSWVDFTDINFSGCSLKSTNFSNCNFTGAVLTGTELTAADLSGATLTGTNLGGAVMHGTKFDGVDLTSTDFGPTPNFRPAVVVPPTATSPRTSFAKATLPPALIGLDWTVLDLSGTSLIGTGDLSGVNAQYAKLSGTGLGLSGVKLVGANFSNADIAVDFSNSHFSETLDEPITTFENATLHNTNFSGAKLVGANFKNIQGSRTETEPGANFSSAYMVNALLTEANLVKTSFSGAQLYGTALLDNANLQEADFSNSILAGLNLNEARLRGAVFDGAILINATLREVDLTPTADGNPTRFVGANLIGTDFRGAHLDSANLDNAVIALNQGVPLFILPQLATWGPDLDRNHVSASLRGVFGDNGQQLRECAAVYTVTLGY